LFLSPEEAPELPDPLLAGELPQAEKTNKREKQNALKTIFITIPF
jgi:hypothetical protein